MCAMRLLSREDFNNQLRQRGCKDTGDQIEGVGGLWLNPNGQTFIVPEAEDLGGKYPDWMLDDLIFKLELPVASA